RERAEIKVHHLNRVYAVLSGINTLIVRVRNRDELFRQACEIAVEVGKFKLTWIGAVDRATMSIKGVAWHGAGDDFIAQIPTGLDPAKVENYGIAGRAVVEQEAVIVDDMATDPRVLPRQDSLRRGIHSLAALPLIQ